MRSEHGLYLFDETHFLIEQVFHLSGKSSGSDVARKGSRILILRYLFPVERHSISVGVSAKTL